MPRRYLLLACCLAVGAFCARLGVWQLDRLSQRRAANAEILAGMQQPPVVVESLGGQVPAQYQRIRASGGYDYSREVALVPRARGGSPGGHIVTPLRRPGTDTLIPVVRGWVYAPDAVTVDFERWHEADSALVDGYAMPLDTTGAPDDASARNPRSVRRLDRERLAARFGGPLAPYYIVMTTAADTAPNVPARLERPTLNDGPHLSYAVQWFLFGAVFGIGGAVVALRRPRTASARAASRPESAPRR